LKLLRGYKSFTLSYFKKVLTTQKDGYSTDMTTHTSAYFGRLHINIAIMQSLVWTEDCRISRKMLHLFYSIQQNPFFMQTTEMNCLLSHQPRLTAWY